MINKELKNEAREIETLTADDKKLRQMLGGLKKEQKVLTRRGFPILMDIPVLGNLFGNH